ncbi:hypothetical protein BOTBODRAFT_192246 [Botryobasidium botryosum FD-172 SS1]|uniref:methylated diphthine methylhydrolase n=1 Tax=Botryobasidium botryosum (strain FD-172 SS1) TaxID=930990 RepID=A0A067M7X7_BOTB1|nr:hypothetical protein BOTBODRAFT_192246 [Botryobasidium botryosum FD-172 SS1]
MPHINTEYSADSVEFCPGADILVCGTYQLSERASDDPSLDAAELSSKQNKRLGRCLVYQIGVEDSSISEIQRFGLPAVLDMKWCHGKYEEGSILAIADAEGRITLHRLNNDQRKIRLEQVFQCAPPDVLCLSLDWSNRRWGDAHSASLIVSRSDGELSLLRCANGDMREVMSWHAHEFEPWIAAWNYWDANIVYSGGDDCKLKGWDVRQDPAQPTFVNRRFDAGVTTIQSHPHVEHIFAVGSYDASVRLFDARKPLAPLSTSGVGGGVWRVKWHPSAARSQDLLVACMHDGFKVVRFGETYAEEAQIVKRYDAHDSLAYGVDWAFEKGEKSDTLIASCSFYDHSLHLWRG